MWVTTELVFVRCVQLQIWSLCHQAIYHVCFTYFRYCKFLRLEIQPTYGELLSSFCGGLQPSATTEEPYGPKGDLAKQTERRTDKKTNGRTTGVREFDILDIVKLLSSFQG